MQEMWAQICQMKSKKPKIDWKETEPVKTHYWGKQNVRYTAAFLPGWPTYARVMKKLLEEEMWVANYQFYSNRLERDAAESI